MILELNKVLMLVGVEIRDNGHFYSVSQAQSLGEVQRRTKELRDKLTGYRAHSEVLRCCRDELLAEDYFHTILLDPGQNKQRKASAVSKQPMPFSK